jgi:hypothetical protein
MPMNARSPTGSNEVSSIGAADGSFTIYDGAPLLGSVQVSLSGSLKWVSKGTFGRFVL